MINELKINLITLINLISKKAPISKLGFGISLGQLEIRIIRNLALVVLFSLILSLAAVPAARAQIFSIPSGSLGATVQASVGEFYLNLSGFVSPFASIVLSSDGVLMRTTMADEKGNFSIPQVLIRTGFSHFCLDAIDFKRIGESYTCFTIPPATDSVTMTDIFLPPTLGLSRTQVNAGGSATAFGYTMPKAKVTLHINNKLIIVYADSSGYYQIPLDNLAAGKYSLYATANYEQKESLEPTKKLQLESLSKSQQVAKLAGNWWDQLLKFLRDWLWNPLWLVIPILILIIILIRKLWGKQFIIPFRRKTHYLHHFWWMGY